MQNSLQFKQHPNHLLLEQNARLTSPLCGNSTDRPSQHVSRKHKDISPALKSDLIKAIVSDSPFSTESFNTESVIINDNSVQPENTYDYSVPPEKRTREVFSDMDDDEESEMTYSVTSTGRQSFGSTRNAGAHLTKDSTELLEYSRQILIFFYMRVQVSCACMYGMCVCVCVCVCV